MLSTADIQLRDNCNVFFRFPPTFAIHGFAAVRDVQAETPGVSVIAQPHSLTPAEGSDV